MAGHGLSDWGTTGKVISFDSQGCVSLACVLGHVSILHAWVAHGQRKYPKMNLTLILSFFFFKKIEIGIY